MMNTTFKSFILLMLATVLPLGVSAATVVEIPTTAGSYIDWNNCDIIGDGKIENNGANIGSTKASTVASFAIQNTIEQDYILTFAMGSKNAAKMKVTLTDGSNKTILEKDIDIENTGNWTPSQVTNLPIDALPIGTYTLKFAVTEASNYAGNWGKLAFYTTDAVDKVPGTLTLSNASFSGSIRIEGDNSNVGWVKNGDIALHPFKCTKAGVYSLTMDIARYGDCQLNLSVIDDATGKVEAQGSHTIDSNAPKDYTSTTIALGGELTTGMKKLRISFNSESSGFLVNYKNMAMAHTGDHYASISGLSIEGQNVTDGDDSDWYCQLPANYSSTTTFGVTAKNGTVNVTAKSGEKGITVTDNGNGTYTLPTPAPSETTLVNLALTPDEGTASSQTVYTFKLFRIGEISLTDVLIDGFSVADDVLTTLNEDAHQATYNNVFTAVPSVTVKVIDGSSVTVDKPTISGTSATYTLHTEMAGKTRDYQLTLNGLHIYNKVETDESVLLKYSSEGVSNNVWSNGLYSLSPIGDGWNNSGFKMKGGSLLTLTVPTDVKVKQLIVHEFSDNYAKGEMGEVSSEGATIYVPMKHDFINGTKYDLVINLENHVAGHNITMQLKNGSQTTGWFELVTEHEAVQTPPVLKNQSVTPTTQKNHCVVTLSFDREMKDTEATIGNQTINAEGGSAQLYFPIWDLEYSKKYTFTVAAGAAKDNYGNSNAEAINIEVEVGDKPVVETAAYDYVVSTADEFSAAIAAVNETNKQKGAARKVIFVKNGDYDFGSAEQNLKAYNVSIIGESMDGVVLHGRRSDISNPIMQINNTGGDYFQDFTIRNDVDFDQAKRVGVAVCLSGGKQAVFKHIAMQSQQDTQVTGESGYYLNCKLYGAVDFICGGGDHYYDQCELIMTNGGYITAPSTSPLLKWGYVFQGCTINGYKGSYSYTGGYTLGRPWQNEPRCYFLNTQMNLKPSDNGWGGMSSLPTHFYEYNSIDKDGKTIDLSVRKNAATSTNTYKPVLTEEEATRFTVENVLGGTDSWLPTEETVETAAPVVATNGKQLSWSSIEGARCYVIFKDGAYLTNQTTTAFVATEQGIYTVRSANRNGGLCGTSNAVTVSDTTGIQAPSVEIAGEDEALFSLAGQRVGKDYKGIVVKNGKKLVNK